LGDRTFLSSSIMPDWTLPMSFLGSMLRVFLFLCCAICAVQAADDFPSAAPIRLIVPSTAGGPTDLIARRFADKLSERLNQRIVIENRPGARAIAPTEVARAKPDGYTILFTVDTYLTSDPMMYATLPYDPVKDFEPVAIVTALKSLVLTVSNSLGVKTLDQYLEKAKSQPNTIAIANSGNGSPNHLVASMFALHADVRFLHVPYRGANLAVSDLMGGHVASMFIPAQNAVGPIKEGRVVPLAVTGKNRFSLLPEVPTFAEAGQPAIELNEGFWYGALVPAGTPPQIVAKLSQEFLEIAKSDEMKKSLTAMGLDPLPLDATEMAKTIREDSARWNDVIKKTGIKIE
jgi:tripartite-type tricarboxylate transporter receptor subunit TctC